MSVIRHKDTSKDFNAEAPSDSEETIVSQELEESRQLEGPRRTRSLSSTILSATTKVVQLEIVSSLPTNYDVAGLLIV